MGQLTTKLSAFPVPFPLSLPSIRGAGKAGKRERTRKVPKREKREKREGLCLLAYKPILWKKSLINLDQMEIFNMEQKKAAHEPATLDGKTLRVLPTPQIKLATIDDCRREMARVYRDARLGDTDTSEASRLVYMLSTLAKLIETSQLEERIAALEKPQPTKQPMDASKSLQKCMDDQINERM